MALMSPKIIFFFFFFFFYFIFFFTRSSAELIKALPGQPPNVAFKQYSGSVVTDPKDGRSLFYYFVEADNGHPLTSPVTLWLNGGPGCSSLGFGAFMEHGPFQPDKNGELLRNKYSWNSESNMLYVESPIGVGFSYSNTSSNYIEWNDTTTAQDNLRFLISWFEEFPQYKDSDLFLTGESYAGHYIPQLATLILEYNKIPNIKPIKLKAIALGNPLLDLDISISAENYLWSHGAISDNTFKLMMTVCNDSRYLKEYFHDKWSKDCNDVFNIVNDEIGEDIERSDLLLPLCLSTPNVEQLKTKGKHAVIHAKLARRRASAGNPCITDWIFSYLNRPDVQKALNANTTGLPFHWAFCEGYPLISRHRPHTELFISFKAIVMPWKLRNGSCRPLVYQEENMDINLIPMVSDILKSGIPIMLYSGDQDTKIPLTQTRIIANILAKELQFVPFTKYGPWYDKKQIGGWAQSFGGLKDGRNVTYLTYATARGAAHEVPYTSPSLGLALFKTFLAGSPLPAPRK